VEEGTYQCQASVRNVGVLLSRMAHVEIACKFILYCIRYLICFFDSGFEFSHFSLIMSELRNLCMGSRRIYNLISQFLECQDTLLMFFGCL